MVAIARLGEGTRERPLAALLIGSLALCADSWDAFLLVYALSDISETFHLGLGVTALALMGTYSTRWLGGMVFGSLANRFGRKRALMISVLWFSVFTMLTGAATSFAMLLVIRVLFGLGMGGAYAAGGSLVTESAGNRYRGFSSGVYMSGFYIGQMMAPIAYSFISPVAGWRGLFLFGGISLLLIPAIALWVVESPVWLAAKRSGSIAAHSAFSVWRLFLPGLLGITLALIAIEFGEFFIAYPFTALMPAFLKAERNFAVATIAFAGSGLAFGALIGSLVGSWLSDLFGRKPVFAAAYVAGTLPTLVAMYAPSTNVIVAASALAGVVIGVLGGLVTAFENEHYPTEIRSAGNGFVHNLGAFGGSIGAVIAAFLRGAVGFQLAILSILMMGVILGITGLVFTRETAGVSLLDIDAQRGRRG
jgi:MFS family permease